MGDAKIERAAQDRAVSLQRAVIAEVVPEPDRDLRELDPAASAATITDLVVTVTGGDVDHELILSDCRHSSRPCEETGSLPAPTSGSQTGLVQPELSGSSAGLVIAISVIA